MVSSRDPMNDAHHPKECVGAIHFPVELPAARTTQTGVSAVRRFRHLVTASGSG